MNELDTMPKLGADASLDHLAATCQHTLPFICVLSPYPKTVS